MKQVEVVAAIIIENGRVFSALRPPKGEVGLKWEFPGGKLEPGETDAEALRRELKEELAVDALIGEYFCTVSHRYQTFELTMRCYMASIKDGAIRLTEHLDSRWLAVDELDSVDWAPADKPILEALRVCMSKGPVPENTADSDH